MSKRSLFLTLSLFFFGCTSNEKPSYEAKFKIPERPLYAESPISALLDSLRPATKQFSIYGNTDTLLTDSGRISIAIDANTFINASGETVQGKIDLEIVEVTSFSDMIGAGLQTVSEGQILQTSGMIYINARSSGKDLAIREGKSIVIDLKGTSLFTDARIFTGTFAAGGNIDWKKISSLETSLITIPSELLNFNNGAWECRYNDEQIAYLKKEAFANTYISTREFEYRMNVFNYYATCPQMKDLDDEIIQIYSSNTGNNLYLADSLVAAHLATNYGDIIDTTHRARDFSDSWWITFLYESALDFQNQRLTQPVDFAALGITDTTTTERLIKSGYSEHEATKLINLLKIRKQEIQARTAEQKVRRLVSYTFPITELGWVNVDRFMNDPKAKESNFTIKVNAKDSLDYIAVQLIIPKYSVVLSGIENGKNHYSFTKKQEEYRKLPVEEKAIIVALSYQKQTPYFGILEIKIPTEGVINLGMEPSTTANISAELLKLVH